MDSCIDDQGMVVFQVARCTKIIKPGTEEAKYVINVKQIAKVRQPCKSYDCQIGNSPSDSLPYPMEPFAAPRLVLSDLQYSWRYYCSLLWALATGWRQLTLRRACA
jgi:hypothetical protein